MIEMLAASFWVFLGILGILGGILLLVVLCVLVVTYLIGVHAGRGES